MGVNLLLFVMLTVLCWGVYGPILHEGQEAMGEAGQLSRLRPFICVGIAYFLIAVVYPLVMLKVRGETGRWSASGFFWSFIAGALGALGALGIILAFNFNARPIVVMPLVFGCAPVINTLVTMAMARTFRNASAVFYVGVVMVALGGAGVLFFRPVEALPVDLPALETTVDAPRAAADDPPPPAQTGRGWLATATLAIMSIAMAALCWGAYGPVLHLGQMRMAGSRLRPFLCVGLAYFVIAVALPSVVLPALPDPGGWNFWGILWSLAAGAAGALGALGIINAFNFGGRPVVVMPLVFGGAPVVNTLVTSLAHGWWDQLTIWFLLSLLLVIAGAVVVLLFAPKTPPKA